MAADVVPGAKRVVLPGNITATSWPAVRGVLRIMREEFDPWQAGLAKAICAKREDGHWAADTVGLSMPRQIGKTHVFGRLVIAWCLRSPLEVIWTAHRTKVSGETFRAMRQICSLPSVKPHILKVNRSAEDRSIEFRNGSRVIFGARESGAIRGLSKVGLLVCDEAQILSEKALADLAPTLNQGEHSRAIFMGTPPKPSDDSEVFRRIRSEALSGISDDVLWVEFGSGSTSDLDDENEWAVANPSIPDRTPPRTVRRLRRLLSDDDFVREVLGHWDAELQPGVIPVGVWGGQLDTDSVAVGDFAVGVEVGLDLVSASVAMSGRRADGMWHVELVEQRSGAAWVEPYVAELVRSNPEIRSVVADVGGPAQSLISERNGVWYLGGSGVRVTPMTVAEVGKSCVEMLNGLVVGRVWHIGQGQLDQAVSIAGKRDIKTKESGLWAYSRATATSDITPIQAATWALHGAGSLKPVRPLGSSRANRKSKGRRRGDQ